MDRRATTEYVKMGQFKSKQVGPLNLCFPTIAIRQDRIADMGKYLIDRYWEAKLAEGHVPSESYVWKDICVNGKSD